MSKRFLPAALLTLGALGSPAAPAPGPSPQQASPPPAAAPQITFGVEVLYVEVDAIVTDKDGKFVRGLAPEDFEIKEEGKPQKVELAALVDLPLPPPAEPKGVRVVEPDVRSNERPFEGRLYVIVLDDLHTEALRSVGVKKAAQRFIEGYLDDADLAAVVYTSGRADVAQNLTNNRRLLLAAVDKFIGNRLRSSTLNRIDVYNMSRDTLAQNDKIEDPERYERGHKARIALDSLKQVADFLGNIHGRRKAIVYFSEGIDYNIYDPFNNQDAGTVLDGTRDVIAAATRANASIYSVDPRGLHGMFDESMDLRPVEDPSLGLDATGLRNERLLAQESLQVLSEETVGRAAVSTNDFEGAFERIVQDNSSYYVLGYRPLNDRKDGKFRKIQVSVKRPGLTVRARQGYASRRAPRAEAASADGLRSPRELRELMNRPLQQSGLPMAMQAAVFKGAAGKASVAVTLELQASAFSFSAKDGRFQDQLEVTVAAMDKDGKLHGNDLKIPLDLKPETRRLVDAGGFRVVTALELPPGRYQLRAAARTLNARINGSVFQDLEVPDFARAPFALSGLVLASAKNAGLPTAGAYEPLKGVLPGPPTTQRSFYTTDILAVVADVYDSDQQPHSIDVTTRVVQADGAVKFRNDQERASAELQSAGGGTSFVHKLLIPLRDIPPGSYLLQVDARSRLAKRPLASREVQFTVVEPPGAGG